MTEKSEAIAHAMTLDGRTTPEELGWLWDRAVHAYEIVELGTFKGRSAWVMAAATPGQVTCVDTWDYMGYGEFAHLHPEANHNECVVNLRDMLDIGKVRMWRMQTLEAAEKYRILVLHPDLVFVDADHHFEACARDILAWGQVMKKDGILCGHDYDSQICPGVVEAVEKYIPERKLELDGGTIWYVEGRPRCLA